MRPTAPVSAVPGIESEKKVGIALVGIGSLTTGQLIPALRSITKYCKCVAFVTGHREKNLPLAAQMGITPEHVYTYDNFDTIKDNLEVDVVYVVLPNSMHMEYTIRAAKAGKHVLCEKPMANSVEDCHKMIDACKVANRKLMIGYRMRYEPLTLKLIDMTRNSDKLGKIAHIEATCGSNRTNNRYEDVWRIQKPMSGGGALMDMGIYCAAVGALPIGRGAHRSQHDPLRSPRWRQLGALSGYRRNIVFDLKFTSGMTATVTSAYDKSSNRTQLSAEKGNLDLSPLMNYNGNHAYFTPKGGERTEVPFTWAQHFACELDDFAQCLLQDKQTHTPGEEGLRNIKIIMAAYESAKIGKPVTLV